MGEPVELGSGAAGGAGSQGSGTGAGEEERLMAVRDHAPGLRGPLRSWVTRAEARQLAARTSARQERRELREHRSRQATRDLRRVHRDALVFQTARGHSQSRRNVLRAVHAAGDGAGLNGDGREPDGVHDLRQSLPG